MILNLIFSYSGCFFILPVSAFASYDLGSMAGAVASEDWEEKSLSTSSFSISQVTRSSISFSRGLMFSLVFLLSLMYLWKLYLLPLMSHGFVFPNLVPGCLDNFSVFLSGYLYLLPPVISFLFFCLNFVQTLFVHPFRPPGVFAWLLLCWDALLPNFKS